MAHSLSLLVVVLSLFLALFSLCNAQNVIDENAKVSNDTLLWGPYRPNLYFGVRPRIPKSLMTGLLWANVNSFESVQQSKFA